MFNGIIFHLYEGIVFYEDIRESGANFFIYYLVQDVTGKLSFKAKYNRTIWAGTSLLGAK